MLQRLLLPCRGCVKCNLCDAYAGHEVLSTAGSRYSFKFDGTDWTPLGGGILGSGALSTPIAAILVHGRDVYLGGQLGNLGGAAITNIARWDGTNWWPVGRGLDYLVPGEGSALVVAALAMANSKLYVGRNRMVAAR